MLHANVSCVQGNEVEVVESFVYGSLTHCSGGSDKLEIKRRAAFIRVSRCLHWTRTSGDHTGNQAPALQYAYSPNISVWF